MSWTVVSAVSVPAGYGFFELLNRESVVSRMNLRLPRWAAFFVLAWACALMTGCANFYVDNGLRDADTAQLQKPASPKPVQLFFTFQTKGSPNLQATQQIKGQVTELVNQSGLFGPLQEVASADAGVLQITLNNVPLSDDAAAKGFMTGLTLGLAGSTVGDGYACDLQYKAAGTAAPINAHVNHAIYTSLGATSGPQAATKMASVGEAVNTMVRQAVKSLLKKLSDDPQFQGAK